MKALVAVLACAGAVAVSALVQARYTIGKPPMVQFLWHDDEAYVFIGDIRLAWEHSYLAGLVYALGAFGTPVQASTRTTTVFRISPTNESEWRIDNQLPTELVAYGDHVSREDLLGSTVGSTRVSG